MSSIVLFSTFFNRRALNLEFDTWYAAFHRALLIYEARKSKLLAASSQVNLIFSSNFKINKDDNPCGNSLLGHSNFKMAFLKAKIVPNLKKGLCIMDKFIYVV